MTQLNGGTYYANVLTANTFSLYSDTALTTPVDTSAFTDYSFTSATATTTATNQITVVDSSVAVNGAFILAWNVLPRLSKFAAMPAVNYLTTTRREPH